MAENSTQRFHGGISTLEVRKWLHLLTVPMPHLARWLSFLEEVEKQTVYWWASLWVQRGPSGNSWKHGAKLYVDLIDPRWVRYDGHTIARNLKVRSDSWIQWDWDLIEKREYDRYMTRGPSAWPDLNKRLGLVLVSSHHRLTTKVDRSHVDAFIMSNARWCLTAS